MFKHYLRQSQSLATAQELPSGFRKNYAEISGRILPLINDLVTMESDLGNGQLSWKMVPDEWNPPEESESGETETTEKILAWLDTTELCILDVLHNVGECLAALPPSIVEWSDCGYFSVNVELKRLTERPCYHLEVPIEIRSWPDFHADFFARKEIDKKIKNDTLPHYLLDELIPITLLPLIESLWIEMDVHADGRPTWANTDEKNCIAPT